MLFFLCILNILSYPTYAAYGASGILLAIYICEWKWLGQYIPVWNKRYIIEDEE